MELYFTSFQQKAESAYQKIIINVSSKNPKMDLKSKLFQEEGKFLGLG